MNKELKDRVFKLPDNVIDFLKFQLSSNKGSFDGFKRARTLLSDGNVTYGQLKRIIHDLKYIDKTKELDRYNLYGGEPMEKWGNSILSSERDLIRKRKESKKRSDVIGGITGERKNAFLSSHSKKSSVLPPLNQIKSNSDSNTASSLNLVSLFEEILKK